MQNFLELKYGKKLVYVFSIFVCIYIAGLAIGEWKDLRNRYNPAQNVITVSATGEELVSPDVAVFSYSIIESAKTVKEAMEKANKKGNKAIEILKENKIENKDIKTTNYSIYPKYEYEQKVCINIYNCPVGKQVLTGYEVTQSVSIKVREIENAGDILSKVGSLEVSNISGLSFEVDDMDAAKAKARDKAIEEAKAKAEKLAKSLGVKLLRITSFYENTDGYYPMYARAEMAVMSSDMAGSAPATKATLATGQNKITSSISITYEIK